MDILTKKYQNTRAAYAVNHQPAIMVDLLSLRITKTSEVSPFVKNVNVAEISTMNKELGMWHRDTRFEMRKMQKDQDRLYRSLFELCKTKKIIKTKIEERLIGNSTSANFKTVTDKPPISKEIRIVNSPNVMPSPAIPPIQKNTHQRRRKKLPRRVLVPLTEENLRKSQERFNTVSLAQNKDDDDVIDFIAKNNKITNMPGELAKTNKFIKGGFVLSAPYMRATPPEYVKRIRVLSGTSIGSSENKKSHNGLFGDKHAIQEEESCLESSRLNSSDNKSNEQVCKRPRKKLKSLDLKRPTLEKLQGKKYTVNVYKRMEGGGFKNDEQVMDTTVDVAKYFKLASHRERLNRAKMLEKARETENQQRGKVTQFLSRLCDENKTIQTRNKIREDEAAALKRRIEMLKMGTPVYGVGGKNDVPAYIRNYVSPLRRGLKSGRRARKRSSWSVPSLYLLEQQKQKTMRAGTTSYHDRQNKNIKQFHPEMSSFSSASHLVNINIDKYLLEAAKLAN